MIKTDTVDIQVCDTFATRAAGLLAQQPISSRTAVWLLPCRVIHTFGMREPLSVLLLDAKRRAIRWVSPAKPNRIYGQFGVASIIEMAYRPPEALTRIQEDLMDVLSRIDEAENFLVGRVEAGVKHTADHDV